MGHTVTQYFNKGCDKRTNSKEQNAVYSRRLTQRYVVNAFSDHRLNESERHSVNVQYYTPPLYVCVCVCVWPADCGGGHNMPTVVESELALYSIDATQTDKRAPRGAPLNTRVPNAL